MNANKVYRTFMAIILLSVLLEVTDSYVDYFITGIGAVVVAISIVWLIDKL